jgi:ankyrin repeat protein
LHFNSKPLADEPLRLAIKSGHYECAEYLLQHGADPNAIYFLGSELHLAASQPCSVPYVELLLKHGANIESRDRSGLTPLMRVAKQPNGYEAVKLLLRYGAQVNCYAPEQQDYRFVLHLQSICFDRHKSD